MKRKIFLLLIIVAFTICSAGLLWADPIINISNEGAEDYLVAVGGFSIGDRFAYYENTGRFMDVFNYNNESNISQVQADVIAWFNDSPDSPDSPGSVAMDFTLVDSSVGITVTGVDYDGNAASLGASASGTFQVDTSIYPGGIEFYAVKAGNDFAMYYQMGGETNGSWSTYDLWDYFRTVEGSSRASLEISHFTGYNGSSVPVPEPATMLLLGTGLVGLAGVGRKKFFKK